MRLGLVIPSVNVVIEEDLHRFLPGGVSGHITRIGLTGTTREALEDALAASVPAARLLAHAGVQAIALACTGASMVADGQDPAARMEAASGVSSLDTMQALQAAFAALGVTRILLFSPFDDAFNAIEAASFGAMGLVVVRTIGLGMRDPRLCPDISPETIVETIANADLSGVESVFLSCANLRGFEAVTRLEAAIGRPVVTTNQAIIWALLRKAGSVQQVAGGGTLFSHQ